MKLNVISAVFFVSLVAALSVSGPSRTASGKEPAESAKVSVEVLNWEQTQKLVARHKGQIVVLDAWSTSCAPCKEEFPNLVKLHQRHGKDVACISMSCDYAGIKNKPPEFYRERVLKFLREQEATV